MTIEWVVFDGPPPVNGIMMSNNCRLPKIDKKTETLIVGSNMGIFMNIAEWKGPAPSILEASITSFEIACSPAM